MSRTVRIGLIFVGVVIALGGLFAWSIEDEYGSRLDYSTKPDDGRIHVLESSSGAEPVFVGSREDAFDYMEHQRAGRESFLIPGVIIGAGVIS